MLYDIIFMEWKYVLANLLQVILFILFRNKQYVLFDWYKISMV